jgi:murein DD-endopeptidase MepM/ murein hydrolase activator NlpD
MDSIDVTKGDIVEQGQVIGKIGNSGSTFGALGGNHVHFEIGRDNAGRPAFYYDKCPALVDEKKSFTEITNGGLCRPYREKAQLDPISFIESSKGKQVASLTPLVGTVSSSHGVAIVTDEKSASKLLPEFVELKKINAAKLTQDAILFVRERDIQLVATYAKTMKLKEK